MLQKNTAKAQIKWLRVNNIRAVWAQDDYYSKCDHCNCEIQKLSETSRRHYAKTKYFPMHHTPEESWFSGENQQ